MIIIVVDLLEMLLIGRGPVGDATASRPYLLVAVVLAATPLCLPHEILQLRFTSSLSVIAILFTCACIVGLALTDDGEGYSESEISAAAPASVSWVLAMPIFSLAYCSQFNVLDISHTLPKPAPPPSETASEVWIQAPPRALSLSIPGIPTPPSSTASLQNEAVKRNDANDLLSHVVHLAMGFAFLAYAIVGIACYTLLGESALNYPNVLTAFGEVPLVALGSAAIACVNFLKLPLVLLPLRALLLEAVAGVTKPIGFIPNLVLTAGILAASGLLAAFAGNLAIAFQLAGSTAGVMVCFVLPGAMHVASLRIEGARDIPEPEDEKDIPWPTEWKCRQYRAELGRARWLADGILRPMVWRGSALGDAELSKIVRSLDKQRRTLNCMHTPHAVTLVVDRCSHSLHSLTHACGRTSAHCLPQHRNGCCCCCDCYCCCITRASGRATRRQDACNSATS